MRTKWGHVKKKKKKKCCCVDNAKKKKASRDEQKSKKKIQLKWANNEKRGEKTVILVTTMNLLNAMKIDDTDYYSV